MADSRKRDSIFGGLCDWIQTAICYSHSQKAREAEKMLEQAGELIDEAERLLEAEENWVENFQARFS